jgi:SAM-dependent methyltransferase
MTPSARERKGHAVLDLPSRDFKALKIAALLGFPRDHPARRMLEIGTGSGGIAHFFGHSGWMDWEVESVDVEDVRLVAEGYGFTLVDGVRLPFGDGAFDVVVSNHVIEHVGDATQQRLHLQEMKRVLADDGVAYLAVPGRWMVVEPHYRLPFLSWLPSALADAYVRIAGKGSHYDCRPLTVGETERELEACGFAFEQQHANALRITFELENPGSRLYRRFLRPLPEGFYAMVRRLFPTLIYVVRHAPRCDAREPCPRGNLQP